MRFAKDTTLVALLGAAGITLLGLLLAIDSEWSAPSLLLLAYVLVALLLPVHYVPPLMLAVFVLLPVRYFDIPGPLAALGPNVFVALILLLRLAPTLQRSSREQRVLAALVAAASAWLLLASLRSVVPSTSFTWTVSFVVLALGVALAVSRMPASIEPIRVAWLVLAALVAGLAIVEVVVLRNNPIYGDVYALNPNGRPLEQVWSVYRATTTLGHPLVNGLFLACGVVLAAQQVLLRPGLLGGVLLALILTGLLLTASRGPLAAAVIGVALLIAVGSRPMDRLRQLSTARLALLALVGVLALGAASTVVTESGRDSLEARESLTYRQDVVPVALGLARARPLTGFGPGTAGVVSAAALGYRPGEFGGAIENSWLELLVAIGVPGAFLVLALLADALRRAITTGAGVVLGLLATFAVAAAGFNWLEASRGGHLLLGLLLGWAFTLRAAAGRQRASIGEQAAGV